MDAAPETVLADQLVDDLHRELAEVTTRAVSEELRLDNKNVEQRPHHTLAVNTYTPLVRAACLVQTAHLVVQIDNLHVSVAFDDCQRARNNHSLAGLKHHPPRLVRDSTRSSTKMLFLSHRRDASMPVVWRCSQSDSPC